MIYKFVFSIIVLNLIFEIIEMIFPSKKMKNMVKSFVLILFFKEMILLLKNLL